MTHILSNQCKDQLFLWLYRSLGSEKLLFQPSAESIKIKTHVRILIASGGIIFLKKLKLANIKKITSRLPTLFITREYLTEWK